MQVRRPAGRRTVGLRGAQALLETRRSKRFLSLKDRLVLYANEVRERAARLPPGIERDALLKKALQADAAADVENRSGSPKPPD